MPPAYVSTSFASARSGLIFRARFTVCAVAGLGAFVGAIRSRGFPAGIALGDLGAEPCVDFSFHPRDPGCPELDRSGELLLFDQAPEMRSAEPDSLFRQLVGCKNFHCASP